MAIFFIGNVCKNHSGSIPRKNNQKTKGSGPENAQFKID